MKAKMVYVVVALMMVFSLAPALMLAMPVMAQGTIYVDVNDGSCVVGSGQSDPYAVVYCKIQDAIDDAIGGDTVILAVGQYNEHDIIINKSLVIQGAGSGSTVVDAGNSGGVFYINASTVDMSGMMIRNGNTSFGGGIFKYSGNLTMTDCIVSNNAGIWGGGIFIGGGVTDTGTLTMTGCTINGNTATWGGGILTDIETLTMTGCTISNNTATWGGGIDNGAQLTMTSCTVSGNTASWGGGISNFAFNGTATVTMTGCTVSGNTASTDGGGIHNDASNGTATVTMTNCTVSGNTASNSGGGIHNYGALTLTNCTISGNEAETRNGGGIYTGGSYYQTITSSTPDDGSYSWSIPLSYDDYSSYKVKITDTSDSSCQDYSNSYFALYDGCDIHVISPTGDENWELGSTHNIDWTSQLTGGNVKIELYKGSSTLNMTNCTVSNNDADKEGGGIYNDGLNTLTLRCTIVYGNMAGDDGDDIMNLSIVDDPTDESIVGDAVGYTGGGPNPLLGPLQNNGGTTETHALAIFSPAIDGCTQYVVVTDQRGVLRPVDGDLDGTADCDVGAYEYVPPPPSAVPTLSQWGMIGMGILLAAVLVWSVRRRWVISADKD